MSTGTPTPQDRDLASLLERVATLERRVADLEIENRTHARMDTRLCELERRAEEDDARARGEQP